MWKEECNQQAIRGDRPAKAPHEKMMKNAHAPEEHSLANLEAAMRRADTGPDAPSDVLPVMLQRWHEISFFHWSCDPLRLLPRLPPGLTVDTFRNAGWISLTPFLLKGLRPPAFPERIGMEFPETNLRTYVQGPDGPGIWFFSLDAASSIAVAAARWTYGLPYYLARMKVETGAVENCYESSREHGASVAIRVRKSETIEEKSALEVFLTDRFRLYALRRGRLVTARVAHEPWILNRVDILDFRETVRSAMAVDFPSSDFLAHHSPGVDTRIGRPMGCAYSLRTE